ncbi:hypothetical protein EDD59_12530 [Muricomes intestini]|uniref:CARDB protein n=1 Tax=Muricomes intestini TaxID=1796634 RepID=A0A4V2URC6_9FIRM|nr:hypothetical protein [Muricomes intestini]TCS76207.1 hypothetical protein EDD59_12530 [Muricomes intestini]
MKLFKRGVQAAVSLALAVTMIMPLGVRAEDEKPIPNITISVGRGQPTPKYDAEASGQTLEFDVENQGSVDAKNVKITPVIEDASAWPFEIEQMNNEKILGDIPAGGRAAEPPLWEDLKVRSDVESKSYRLDFLITYDDGKTQYQTPKYIYVRAKAKPADSGPEQPAQPGQPAQPDSGVPDEGDGDFYGGGIFNSDPVATGGEGSGGLSVPRVIVTGFNTDPGTVNAGGDFKLIVHLKNTSTKTAVSNMLFDLQAPSSGTEAATEAPAFLPSSGSSSIYLDSIPAGGTGDISIALNSRADLVQKPYSIAMSMKYEDGNAAQYESSSSLAIPVKQAARFELSDLEIAPESIAVGEEANITGSLYNTGRIKLYNVKVKFQGKGIDAKEVFIGNVDSGATGTIDGIVTGTKENAGDQKFKMIVTYEDEAGKVSTTEKEFTLEITPQQEPVNMSQMTDAPVEKGFPVILLVIGLTAAAVVIAVIFIIRRKKKRIESVEEEDLADEVDRFTEDE